ncbi:hypothetical protein QWY85_06970 [Neolewinella lacunae]|uniref:Uncharacterized protein n=1 Tax=Neolewinella lacunae TaxID=1517758 RepID=A0A923PN76_9BACT|nr:hypothetical protein [Neolewinella lacunae]MBC6994771.1 hypothetical protein [Neolewinella lacunae]MDN3634393.1 hypothetical protein [Neolewinella lacunae]
MGTVVPRPLLLLVLTLAWASCDQGAHASVDEHWEQLQPLVHRQQRLRCTMDSLRQQAVQLWDGVVETLDAQLPATMPAEERRNMLAVRNRSLIQMFMAYDSLSPGIQQRVEIAGVQDSLLALAIKANNAQTEALARTLDSTLMALKPQMSSAEFRTLTEQLAGGSDKNASPPCAH